MYKQKDVAVDEKELIYLKKNRVAVIGCGGWGGYVLEMLARFGVGEVVVVDDDVFDLANINKQVISSHTSLGKYKVNEAVLWIKQVNPFIYVKGVIERLNKDNAMDILEGADVVIDCVDNVETKFILQSSCEKLNIPLIYGAVEYWKGQVSTILPYDGTLDKIYPDKSERTQKLEHSSYFSAAVASYQVTECIKILLDKGSVLKDKVMYIDLFDNKVEIIDL